MWNDVYFTVTPLKEIGIIRTLILPLNLWSIEWEKVRNGDRIFPFQEKPWQNGKG